MCVCGAHRQQARRRGAGARAQHAEVPEGKGKSEDAEEGGVERVRTGAEAPGRVDGAAGLRGGAGFPGGVTAFRPEMAAHGRFGQPRPRCGQPMQPIRYANNETN